MGRRGLVGLFVMYKSYCAKGRGIEPRSLLLFSFENLRIFELSPATRKRSEMKRRQSQNAIMWRHPQEGRRERRIEEEEPAGVSGMATRERLSVRFEDD